MEQRTKKENSNFYGQPIYNNGGKYVQWGKESL